VPRRVHDESFNDYPEREVLVPVREVHERRVPVDDTLSDAIEELSLPVVVGVCCCGEEHLDDWTTVESNIGRVPKAAAVRTVQHVHEVVRVAVVPCPAEEAHGCFPCQ